MGGYTEAGDAQVMEREQFELGDIRPLDEVVRELLVDGYIPSFCTACYRLGRTGEHFMEFAIPGFIQNLCTPNALSTLMEYLVDYASPETRTAGEAADPPRGRQAARGRAQAALLERLRRIARPTSGICTSDDATADETSRRSTLLRLHADANDRTIRRETDLLGSRDVPADALWGIHTLRAMENFPLAGRPVHRGLVHAFGAVKLAAARTNHELGRWDDAKFAAIEAACQEMIDGRLDEHVVVDALQGGAGTSTNMNVNEVLANRALQLLGRPLGDYADRQPARRHQPAPIDQRHLSHGPARGGHLRPARPGAQGRRAAGGVPGRRRKQFADVVKIGRTELQDAVLMTLGREMAAYAEAFARDRWRIYKCEERLRVVNLGGTAIGTGLGAPRQYIFRVVEHLRQITGLGLARAENLVEATQNADVFVEVSGILRTLAANLLKIANDLRLLSSGPARRAGRNPPAAAPGRLVDHARQGQSGDPRGRGPGGHRRDGPRPDDRAGRRRRQPRAEPVPAAGGRQPARRRSTC